MRPRLKGHIPLEPEHGLRAYAPPWCWTWAHRWAPSELRIIPTNVSDLGDHDEKWFAYRMTESTEQRRVRMQRAQHHRWDSLKGRGR